MTNTATGAAIIWVVVKGLNLSYQNPETISFII